MGNILIIENDSYYSADVSQFCQSLGHSIKQAENFNAAIDLIGKHVFDVIVSNAKNQGETILGFITVMKKKSPDSILIVYTELDNIADGASAVEAGAFTVLQKPFTLPELNFQIKRAFHISQEKKGIVQPPISYDEETYKPYNFIGESPQINHTFKIINRVAKTNTSVIILGETGTGKELVAGAIHYNSHKSDGPFVRVNCAALPDQLLESELFGYEKGAFTGADKARIGRFEHANNGTIFLDEVADMSLFTQAKVLRVIQEKEFERLGSNKSVKTDVRIISATNKDLKKQIKLGQFREDLYYRLNVVTIHLPPLREREGDIGLMIEFFLKRACAEMNKHIRGIEPGALDTLTHYHWPGNIRELENTIERAVLMTEGDMIMTDDLDLFFAGEDKSDDDQKVYLPAKGIRLEDAERQLIEQAMERSGGVQKKAADLLGISTRVMNYKIQNLRKGSNSSLEELDD